MYSAKLVCPVCGLLTWVTARRAAYMHVGVEDPEAPGWAVLTGSGLRADLAALGRCPGSGRRVERVEC